MDKKNTITKPTVLVILDGFGLGDINNIGNAIVPATAPHIFGYLKKYPNSTLKTYGENVGLFPGQVGNSEAGHLNIGAGRIVKQDLVMISEAIHDGIFFKNEAFKQAVHHLKKYKTSAHIMVLLTGRKSPHSFPEHLYAMLEFLRREEVKNVYLHLFTDGRDSSPHGAAEFLRALRTQMVANEHVATIMGRFYGMDRNKLWKRTEEAYNALVLGKGYQADNAEEALSQAYNRGETDEYIRPTVMLHNKKPFGLIKDNDAVFFVNARSDRARQITKVFVQTDFNKLNPGSFKREKVLKNIRFVAMTDFGPDLPDLFTAFPSPNIENCLPLAIKDNYRQLYISETEKYAHVTYFINGGFADPLNGEKRELIKSADIYTYADKPEMNSKIITKKIVSYLTKGTYNFICVNFPNADMVGHTGNILAAKKAIKAVDNSVAIIVETALKLKGQVLITADHGNADEMFNGVANEMLTEHSKNLVPLILISKDIKGVKLKPGILADVAPTLLKLMDIKKPKEMTGKSLL
ncbi:MAG: 2,3-bisphosphoglycerate-independent phosphoglycerate mutase [Candidatus Magasanikbacteria bacterium GW2011_GWC2_37_14]|uniref:2,3-bisphosphoglycerate-independent phosphoglycerate mutase n=1 Tax=Candidatus Magasanikbacteria bacterium GW2011_GWC2_37_14 TaxID=1619046 RepID=A0A0G0GMI1_9BACT|nr:MAG: 2,3-bisphosphoglycerate-independent phosphoglycerate mutase [Candidatus Magasanikbacteria bacterium GW2011_GWC2_37_14]